jgi:hypothetical protein
VLFDYTDSSRTRGRWEGIRIWSTGGTILKRYRNLYTCHFVYHKSNKKRKENYGVVKECGQNGGDIRIRARELKLKVKKY